MQGLFLFHHISQEHHSANRSMTHRVPEIYPARRTLLRGRFSFCHARTPFSCLPTVVARLECGI